VLGLDLLEFRGTLPHHAEIRQQDVMASDLETQLEGERFDVVLSDMAPSTCGHRLVDQTRSFRLVMRAIEIADRVLVVGGHFVAKIFQGPDFDRARGAVAERFADSRIIKPPASRAHSREIFLVGLRKKT
jgi:23S rRNA (uridine2552-2'-O)-methyltransferase